MAYRRWIGIGLASLVVACRAASQIMDRPFLRWNPKRLPAKSIAPQLRFFAPESVAALDDDGRERWRTSLPARMQGLQFGQEHVAALDAIQARWPAALAAHPEARSLSEISESSPLHARFYDVLYFGPAIAIADPTGVLFLSVQDGRIALDYAAHTDGDSLTSFSVNHVKIRIDDAKAQLSCEHQPGEAFAVACGDYLVYFNSRDAALFSGAAAALIARASYHDPGEKDARRKSATLTLGPATLEFSGTPYPE